MPQRSLVLFLLFLLISSAASAQGGTCAGTVPNNAPTIYLGAALSNTGQYAFEGAEMSNGYQIWLDWVNQERGGIDVDGVCHRVEIVFYDDESDANTLTLLMQRLILDDEVDFIFGPASSTLTEVASIISERENMIMMAASGGSAALFERGFRNLFSILAPPQQLTASGIALAAGQGAQSAVIFHDNSAYSTAVAGESQQLLREAGIESLAMLAYPEDEDDFAGFFSRFRDLSPDLFIGVGYFEDSVDFIESAQAVRFIPNGLIFMSAPANPLFVDAMGRDAQFLMGTAQWHPELEFEGAFFGSAADYAQRYQDRFDILPGDYAAQATAAALTLQFAIESAGSTETESVRQALRALNIETFFGPIRFNAAGQNVTHAAVTVQVQRAGIRLVAPREVATAEVVWPFPGWNQ